MNNLTKIEQYTGNEGPGKLTLLGLPRELRDIILGFALVETLKWERRHKYHCSSCPRTSNETEYPLFLVEDIRTRSDHCTCLARSSLNLLLVNSQLNAEGASIFWKKNTFCFKSMAEFSQGVGRTLRPETREMIRHISLVDYGASTLLGPKVFEEFWMSLLQCTGLRTLELDSETLTVQATRRRGSIGMYGQFLRMKTELPHLNSVKWVHAGPAWRFVLELIHLHPVYPDIAMWETTKDVDFKTLESEADVERSNRDFDRYVGLVERAMDAQIFEKVPTCIHAAVLKPLPDEYNDRHNQEELRLKDGSVASVRFYGLPLSLEALMHNMKLRNEEEQVETQPGLSKKD